MLHITLKWLILVMTRIAYSLKTKKYVIQIGGLLSETLFRSPSIYIDHPTNNCVQLTNMSCDFLMMSCCVCLFRHRTMSSPFSDVHSRRVASSTAASWGFFWMYWSHKALPDRVMAPWKRPEREQNVVHVFQWSYDSLTNKNVLTKMTCTKWSVMTTQIIYLI